MAPTPIALSFALNIRDPRLAVGLILILAWTAAGLEPRGLLDVLNALFAAL